jgi:hypothetical protein
VVAGEAPVSRQRVPAWLVCLRTPGNKLYPAGRGNGRVSHFDVWTGWGSAAELAEVDRELLDDIYGCGRGCHRQHLLIWWDGDTVRTARSAHDRRPAPLAVELLALYPRKVGGYPPEDWPAPTAFNEPLEARPPPSSMPERVTNGQRVQTQREEAARQRVAAQHAAPNDVLGAAVTWPETSHECDE